MKISFRVYNKSLYFVYTAGACLILSEYSSAVYGYRCGNFSFGCPNLTYFSNEIYKRKHFFYQKLLIYLKEINRYVKSSLQIFFRIDLIKYTYVYKRPMSLWEIFFYILYSLYKFYFL